MVEQGLTAQQRKWFASVRANLEANTGKSLDQWLKIARGAPAGSVRERLRWFKAEHGLLQNSATLVLNTLDGAHVWDEPQAQRDVLWANPARREVFEAVERRVLALEGVVAGQRKGYSAWSRRVQFAAVRPVRAGVRLGLALAPGADPRLTAATKSEGWSERLTCALPLPSARDVGDGVAALLRQAWARS